METNLHRFNADRSITIEWRDACNEKQSNNKYFTNNEIRKWNTNHTTQGPLINPQRQFCVNIHTHTHMILIDVLHVNYYIGFEKKKFARIHFVCHSTAEKINKKLHTKLIILDNNAFCIFEGLKKKVIYYFTQKQPSCAHPLFIIRNRINYFFNWLSGIFFFAK